ncbi:hypothetical protein CSA_011905 [Cucumis sativus]|uniref:Uncharacterized protein n=1 Tax=Cucumis sativus TaxID=3659 RepID=A0ACB6HBS2_CUCSA|nr:hypothetical protein CSA_011905 [Cucumis sativus]
MGLNLETGLNPNYGTGPNVSSNLSYGRVMSPSYSGNLNRYGSPNPMVYSGGGGNGSILSSSVQNLWGNVSTSAGTNSSHLRTFPGSGGVHTGTSSLNNIGGLWGASASLGHGENAGSSFNTVNLDFGNGDASFTSGTTVGYARSIGTNVSSASLYSAPNIYDEVHGIMMKETHFMGIPVGSRCQQSLRILPQLVLALAMQLQMLLVETMLVILLDTVFLIDNLIEELLLRKKMIQQMSKIIVGDAYFSKAGVLQFFV